MSKAKRATAIAVLTLSIALPNTGSTNSDFEKVLGVTSSYHSAIGAVTDGDLSLSVSPQGVITTSAWHDGEAVYVGFNIPKGDYLYKRHFSISGEGIETIRIPEGAQHHDEFFGDVVIFRGKVVIAANSQSLVQGEPFNFSASYQGCSDIGICYPPQAITLTAIPASIPPGLFAGATKAIPTAANDTKEQTLHKGGSSDGQLQELLSESPVLAVMLLFFLASLGLILTLYALPMRPAPRR